MKSNRRTFFKQACYAAGGVSLISLFPGCQTTSHLSDSKDPLRRSTPEAQGVSSAGLLSFFQALEQTKHEMHSFMLIRHGQVVSEGWWSPYGPEFNHTLYSLSKSFTSTAVGFAVSEGKLRVDDRVVSFFPKNLPADVSENLAALRVKDLLTMSVGNADKSTNAMVEQENWVKFFLGLPIGRPPGRTFMYDSAATYMLSAIVQQVTGQKLVDYLEPRLFEPLGIGGATWETCPHDINVGGWGLSLQTESLAKFGQLYLQKGIWNGRQILPASWVSEATTFKIQQPPPVKTNRPQDQNDWLQGYCYQFWRCTHNGFRGDGAFGQFTIVLPEQDAVIAITSETSDMQGQLDLIWEYLLPAFKTKALSLDPGPQDRLEQKLSSLKLPFPKGATDSPRIERISDTGFKLESNDLGLQSIWFKFREDGFVVTFKGRDGNYPIPGQYGGWQRSETALPGTPPRLISGGAPKPGTQMKVAAAGAWTDDDVFEMVLRYYETPHHDTVRFQFGRDNVTIGFMSSISQLSANPKDKRPTLHGQILNTVGVLQPI